MSNLIGENDDGELTRTSSVMSSYQRSAAGSNPNRSSSSSNLNRMKIFLSSKQLDQVQISLISKQKIRSSIRGTGSEGELAVRSKYRENLHPEDPGQFFVESNLIRVPFFTSILTSLSKTEFETLCLQEFYLRPFLHPLQKAAQNGH